MKENVTLTQQEQARLQVLNNLLAGYMTTEQAATLMGVSARHTRRMLAAYREKGAAAIAHGNRGRRPANATPETMTAAVMALARTRYTGVNHTHMSELLGEYEGIDITRSTLRRLLVSAGENSPRGRRPPKHRVRRQRMPREGMLIQVDGSYHRWLGEDGPQFTLLLAVDDATGVVVNALFCEMENTRSYFLLLDGLIRRRGMPLALYVDRHAVFKHTPSQETAAAPTQFSRAMDELGVHLIFARSPQVKGRVERMVGTFQDRLVTELRLAEAATIDDANRVLADFLPRFNQRFRVPPQHSETAYRVLDPQMCLDTTLCIKSRRRVGRDNTVKYRWRTLQLLPGTDRPSYAGAVVDVLEGLGRLPGSAARGADHPHTGGTAAPQYPAQLHRENRAYSCTSYRQQWPGQTLGRQARAARRRGLPRHRRRQRRRKGSQGRDFSPEEAHTTSDGEMESGEEGEAQGAVHSWDRPGTGHTQRHREEVYER